MELAKRVKKIAKDERDNVLHELVTKMIKKNITVEELKEYRDNQYKSKEESFIEKRRQRSAKRLQIARLEKARRAKVEKRQRLLDLSNKSVTEEV